MTPCCKLCLVGAWLVAAPAAAEGLDRYEFTQPQMGVSLRIVLYAENEEAANRAAMAAMARVRELNGILSDYDAKSELNRLGRSAGQRRYVAVGDDLWRVLRRAGQVAAQSDGAFDMTVGPYVRLWRRAGKTGSLPTDGELEKARSAVGYRHVLFDERCQAVALTRPDMRLDLGGIAKGYAADEALAVLRTAGIDRALVDLGGDIALGEAPPGRQGWKIGIAPWKADARPSRFLLVRRASVATSGDAWQFVEIAGRRYSHIIDPRTGRGLTERISVTVVAPDGTTADSLASAVSVLGPERGLKLIEATPGAAALVVRKVDGNVEQYESQRFGLLETAGFDAP